MSKYILCITCPDKIGIIASVAKFLSDNNYNILQTSQYGDKTSNQFFMRVVFEPIDREVIYENFHNEISKLSKEFSMKYKIHSEKEKTKAIILVSKTDHCINDILYKYRTNHLNIEITAVISNHNDNKELVERHNIKYEYFPITKDTKKEQENRIRKVIYDTNSELIIMARYMQILTNEFSEEFKGRIINIHHSFLPGFKGAKPYHQAYDRGVKLIGATAHFATADLDEGPIIEQEISRIDHTNSAEQMQIIGKDIEARVLSKAINYYSRRKIFLNGQRTVIL